MEVRYYTPHLKYPGWDFTVPTNQLPDGSTGSWIRVPEGIHNIQVIWEGTKPSWLRFRTSSSDPTGKVLKNLPTPGNVPTMVTVIVPPGGGWIQLGTLNAVTESDVAPGKIIYAGITMFLGTNEPPAST